MKKRNRRLSVVIACITFLSAFLCILCGCGEGTTYYEYTLEYYVAPINAEGDVVETLYDGDIIWDFCERTETDKDLWDIIATEVDKKWQTSETSKIKLMDFSAGEKVKEAISFGYRNSMGLGLTGLSKKSYVTATIVTIEDEEFAETLSDVLETIMCNYIIEKMPILSGYTNTYCEFMGRNVRISTYW